MRAQNGKQRTVGTVDTKQGFELTSSNPLELARSGNSPYLPSE